MNKTGGGVALYINDSLQHKYLPDKSKCIDNCAEVVYVEITLKNCKNSNNYGVYIVHQTQNWIK